MTFQIEQADNGFILRCEEEETVEVFTRFARMVGRLAEMCEEPGRWSVGEEPKDGCCKDPKGHGDWGFCREWVDGELVGDVCGRCGLAASECPEGTCEPDLVWAEEAEAPIEESDPPIPVEPLPCGHPSAVCRTGPLDMPACDKCPAAGTDILAAALDLGPPCHGERPICGSLECKECAEFCVEAVRAPCSHPIGYRLVELGAPWACPHCGAPEPEPPADGPPPLDTSPDRR